MSNPIEWEPGTHWNDGPLGRWSRIAQWDTGEAGSRRGLFRFGAQRMDTGQIPYVRTVGPKFYCKVVLTCQPPSTERHSLPESDSPRTGLMPHGRKHFFEARILHSVHIVQVPNYRCLRASVTLSGTPGIRAQRTQHTGGTRLGESRTIARFTS